MIDPVKILQRAWHILWSYRALMGLRFDIGSCRCVVHLAVEAITAMQYQDDGNSYPDTTPRKRAGVLQQFQP